MSVTDFSGDSQNSRYVFNLVLQPACGQPEATQIDIFSKWEQSVLFPSILLYRNLASCLHIKKTAMLNWSFSEKLALLPFWLNLMKHCSTGFTQCDLIPASRVHFAAWLDSACGMSEWNIGEYLQIKMSHRDNTENISMATYDMVLWWWRFCFNTGIDWCF